MNNYSNTPQDPKTLNQFIDWLDNLPESEKNSALKNERNRLFRKKLHLNYGGRHIIPGHQTYFIDLKALRGVKANKKQNQTV